MIVLEGGRARRLYYLFDGIVKATGCYKIETIGDGARVPVRVLRCAVHESAAGCGAPQRFSCALGPQRRCRHQTP